MNIFIAHVQEEAALARAVATQLERCFARQVTITLGGDSPLGLDPISWRSQALSEADLILVLMSGASYLRPEIARAAGYAIDNHKKAVQLWSRDVGRPREDQDYLRLRPVVIDDPEGVGRLLEEIAISTPGGQLFQQKQDLVAAWLDAVRAAAHASSGRPADPAGARRLLEEHRAAYRAGEMAKAFFSIEAAYVLDPLNPEVAHRYIVALLRYDRLTEIRKLLDTLKERGVYDDNVRMIEGEFLLRRKQYREARDVLDEIENDQGYNVLYLKGMSYLLDSGGNERMAALVRAKTLLEQAHAAFPHHWWVTLNLAIARRLIPMPDAKTEALALEQLNRAIAADPLKASPRMYRLLYFALEGAVEALRATVEADLAEMGGRLELPADLLDWIQVRLELLLRRDPATLSRFTDEISRWATGFRVLTWPPRHAEPA